MAMELFTPPSPSPSSLISSPFKPKPNSIVFSPSTTPPNRPSSSPSPSSSSSSSSSTATSTSTTTTSSSVSAIAAAFPSLSSAFFFPLVGPASATVSYDDIVAPGTTSEGTIDATSAFDAASPLPSLDLDLGGIVDSVSGFVSENPVAVIGGIAAIGIPLLISRLFFSQGEEKPYAIVSPREVFKKLETSGEDGFLLDIRTVQDVKIEGSPDLRSIKKRFFQIPYVEDQDEVFLKKLLSKFKDPSNTTLYILDQFDGNSLSVAKLATSNGFKFAYAIKDGAEGPNGWRKNELPWLLPRKGFTLDIGALKDVIDGTFGESGNLVPASLGVAAAAGVSFVLFSEAETALQLLGSAALVQVFINKFLFAKDRQKTLQELQLFLDTKVAPKELVDEFKGVSGSLLEKFEEIAPSQKNGAVLNIKSPPEVEVETESVATVVVDEKNNSVEVDIVVKEEVDVVVKEKNDNVEINVVVEEKKETVAIGTVLPSSSTSLSPYAQFPDLKPPPPPMPTKA